MWQPSRRFIEQYNNGLAWLGKEDSADVEKNFSGFPVLGPGWWEGEIQTDYGLVKRQDIVWLLSEHHNACVDDYEGWSDEQLRESYEAIREWDED